MDDNERQTDTATQNPAFKILLDQYRIWSALLEENQAVERNLTSSWVNVKRLNTELYNVCQSYRTMLLEYVDVNTLNDIAAW